MGWDPQKLASERAALEFMGSMKYDSYDRYMPGMRFMSSLVQWLNDIDEEDRENAFNFIKEKLVFISTTQMNYLVDLLYDSKIRPTLLDVATAKMGMPCYMRSCKKVRTQFEIEKRSSLVIGLSDGAHTDILRRSAGFSNEQVLTNYYPGGKKLEDMLDELRKDEKLKDIDKPFFHRIFLIDDFTASGKSFIRFDECDGKYHGKLKKIIDELCAVNNVDEHEKHMNYLLDPAQKEIQIDILFCIATEKAMANIEKYLNAFLKSKDLHDKVKFVVYAVQILEDKLSSDIKADRKLVAMLKKDKHFVKEFVMSSPSYEVGKHDEPYFGFDQCALPVVLAHNTPNNSLPIIWQNAERFHGLFPRISRH